MKGDLIMVGTAQRRDVLNSGASLVVGLDPLISNKEMFSKNSLFFKLLICVVCKSFTAALVLLLLVVVFVRTKVFAKTVRKL